MKDSNSNGYWNDAPRSPKNGMATAPARKSEMAWMQRIGIKGIKVDFFGGDKQETIKLYEDILSDANEYGIVVTFHGCTLPGGWERMYPNFVTSGAVLASENLIFNQYYTDKHAYNATILPFTRNVVMARRKGEKWYVVAVNGEKQQKELTVALPMLAGEEVDLIFDREDRTAGVRKVKVDKKGKVKLTLLPEGGAVIY